MGSQFQRCFRALGSMAQEADFDTPAAQALWGEQSEDQARGYLNVLVARSLLKRLPEWSWQQYSILRVYALSLESPEEQRALPQAHASHFRAVVRTCDESKPRNYDRLEREFRQVAHAFSWARKHDSKMLTELALRCDDFLQIRGRFNLRRSWLQASLSAADSLGDRLGRANTLRSLGDLESRLGNLEDARRHYDDALHLFEAEREPTGKMNIALSRARLERGQGDIALAGEFYRQVLAQAQLLPGFAEHPVTQQIRAEYQEMLSEAVGAPP